MSTSHSPHFQQLFNFTSVTCKKRFIGRYTLDKDGMSLNQLEWEENHLREWCDDNSRGEAIAHHPGFPRYRKSWDWADLFMTCDSFTYSAWWRCSLFLPSLYQKQPNRDSYRTLSRKANLLQHKNTEQSLSSTTREQALKLPELMITLFRLCRSRNHTQNTLSPRNSMDAQWKQP